MPFKLKVPCKHPGCAELIPAGQKYCEKHKPLHVSDEKSKPSYGWYGSRWRRESKRFLKVHPLCRICFLNGEYTKATVVDHVIPHRGDAGLFWAQNNWQPLCKKCHDQKTRREDQTPTYGYK